jgi:hypothetical protein
MKTRDSQWEVLHRISIEIDCTILADNQRYTLSCLPVTALRPGLEAHRRREFLNHRSRHPRKSLDTMPTSGSTSAEQNHILAITGNSLHHKKPAHSCLCQWAGLTTVDGGCAERHRRKKRSLSFGSSGREAEAHLQCHVIYHDVTSKTRIRGLVTIGRVRFLGGGVVFGGMFSTPARDWESPTVLLRDAIKEKAIHFLVCCKPSDDVIRKSLWRVYCPSTTNGDFLWWIIAPVLTPSDHISLESMQQVPD